MPKKKKNKKGKKPVAKRKAKARPDKKRPPRRSKIRKTSNYSAPSSSLGQTDFSSPSFQTFGYGGFGYDTSHVKPDDVEPDIVKWSKHGDLAKVKQLVQRFKTSPEEVNKAKIWTECDYKASGFVKTYNWYDMTAVTAAALFGYDDVLYCLLSEGLADPTLIGCPTDNTYFNAFEAHKRGAAKASTKRGGKLRKPHFNECGVLLAAVRPFWETAACSGAGAPDDDEMEHFYNSSDDDNDFNCWDSSEDSEYDKKKKKQKKKKQKKKKQKKKKKIDTSDRLNHTNQPTNVQAMREALAKAAGKTLMETLPKKADDAALNKTSPNTMPTVEPKKAKTKKGLSTKNCSATSIKIGMKYALMQQKLQKRYSSATSS